MHVVAQPVQVCRGREGEPPRHNPAWRDEDAPPAQADERQQSIEDRRLVRHPDPWLRQQ